MNENIADQEQKSFEAWPPNWRAQVLDKPPMIAPARQFTYPLNIVGEEDALARGALHMLVTPAQGGTFLANCALGFTSASVPTGFLSCPNPDELCALAGGYAYIFNTADPASCTHLPMKPVIDVRIVASRRLILFIGFHGILAWGEYCVAWKTARLSWEGIRLGTVEGDQLSGFGWNLQTDAEVPFTIDLRTGRHEGGAFPQSQSASP